MLYYFYMKKLMMSRSLHVAIVLAVIIGVVYMVLQVTNNQEITYVTTVVERGPVEQLISVSGMVEAEQRAELAFPATGIVSAVNVRPGDVVVAGDVLVTLQSATLAADRQDALAARTRAVATRDELLAGPQSEARAATAESVAFKAASLETIKNTQADLVANAYRNLLSSGLTASSDDASEAAVAPVVSGTYACTEQGTYTLETYSSSAQSGYSLRLSGLESGTYPVSFEQPTIIGVCGLRLLFDRDSRYSNTTWSITIPNQQSSQYTINRNAYTLAQTQAASAIAVAEQDLLVTEANANNTNAPARSESITRANADINSADARIARIDAQIEERVIRAPFAGTIMEVGVLPGETASTQPVVTLLAASDFELTARIPEIDIGKLAAGQPVRAVFDARTDQILTGTVEFISLQATMIEGVAYYEAIISLATTPDWMRSGLNADIDVVILEVADSLRVPSRFITQTDATAQVRTKVDDLVATTTISIILAGNDGYTAITGLNEGDIVVAP